MNPQVKERWLQALRSGKYTQVAQLCYSAEDKSFCCLGVLNDISGLGGWTEDIYYTTKTDVEDGRTRHMNDPFNDPEDWDPARFSGGEEEFSHREVSAWAGLDLQDPVLTITREIGSEYGFNYQQERVPISELNDAGVPFSVLANLIEEQL